LSCIWALSGKKKEIKKKRVKGDEWTLQHGTYGGLTRSEGSTSWGKIVGVILGEKMVRNRKEAKFVHGS